jgi:hypothetical protein
MAMKERDMAMMSGDRTGGGYTTYTTRVPYELSSLTKKVFDLLAKGTTGEKLGMLFGSSSDSDLWTFQKDLSVVKDQDSVMSDPKTIDTLNDLGKMASAELESREPGPQLFSKFVELLAKGTNLAEIERLLHSASSDALLQFPKHLDLIQTNLRSGQPAQVQEMGALLDVVRQVSKQILDQRNSPQKSAEGVGSPVKLKELPIEQQEKRRDSTNHFFKKLFRR